MSDSISHRSALYELRRQEEVNKVLQVIGDNKDGLTWSEVRFMTGGRLSRTILTRLQKEGKIEQRKKMLPSGTITVAYVLTKKHKSSK
jgi:hypothetical protein